MEEFKALSPYFVLVVQLVVLWIGWSLRKRFASPEDLAKERAARQKLEGQVNMLEGMVKQLPTSSGMHELSLAIERLRGDFKGVTAQLAATDKSLVRVEATLARHETIFTQAASR